VSYKTIDPTISFTTFIHYLFNTFYVIQLVNSQENNRKKIIIQNTIMTDVAEQQTRTTRKRDLLILREIHSVHHFAIKYCCDGVDQISKEDDDDDVWIWPKTRFLSRLKNIYL
jgi:hypothetical protein